MALLRLFFNLFILFVLLFTSESFSQKNLSGGNNSGIELPDTEIGGIVKEFISAINSNNANEIAAFTSNYLSDEIAAVGSEKWSNEKYTELMKNLSSDAGLITPIDLINNNSNDYLGVIFTSSKVENMTAIEFAKNKNNLSLRSIELHSMRKSIPYQWTTEKLSDEKIADAINTRMVKEFETGLFSGTVLIARRDKILLNKSYGFADVKNNIPNTAETRFHTGSIGKMITAVAVAQLVEKELLSYSDTLGNILNDYPNEEASENVTVHQLLTHTSGIADPFEVGRRIEGEEYSTPSLNLPLFADIPLNIKPGSAHRYSNGNFTVLAAIVEKISGISFREYIEKNIFIPAGMNAGRFENYKSLSKALRYRHDPVKDPLRLHEPSPFRELDDTDQLEYSGFCNGYLTADDVYKFLLALREGKLVSQIMAETLTAGKVQVQEGAPAKYAYGFYDVNMWGVNMRGHSGGGSNSGIGADAEMLWDNNYYVIVLGNCDLEKVRPISFSLCRFLGTQN